MRSKLLDANFILRYLVETEQTVPPRFKGVFPLFRDVETKKIEVWVADLVVFEVYYVLTGHYKVPRPVAVEKLSELLSFAGIHMADKELILACLEILSSRNVDLVDSYLAVLARKRGDGEIYSFDKDLEKLGLRLLEVK